MRYRALLPLLTAFLLTAGGSAFGQWRAQGQSGHDSSGFSLPNPFGDTKSDADRPTSPWSEPPAGGGNPWSNRGLGPSELPYGRVGDSDRADSGSQLPLSPDYPDWNRVHEDPLRRGTLAHPLPDVTPRAAEENPFGQAPTSSLPTSTTNPFRPGVPPSTSTARARTVPQPANPYPASPMYGPFSPAPAMGPFTPAGPAPTGATASETQLASRPASPYAAAVPSSPTVADAAARAGRGPQQVGIEGWYSEPSNRAAVARLRQQFNSQRGTLHPGYFGAQNRLYGYGPY